jgi:hypothetical protein
MEFVYMEWLAGERKLKQERTHERERERGREGQPYQM